MICINTRCVASPSLLSSFLTCMYTIINIYSLLYHHISHHTQLSCSSSSSLCIITKDFTLYSYVQFYQSKENIQMANGHVKSAYCHSWLGKSKQNINMYHLMSVRMHIHKYLETASDSSFWHLFTKSKTLI